MNSQTNGAGLSRRLHVERQEAPHLPELGGELSAGNKNLALSSWPSDSPCHWVKGSLSKSSFPVKRFCRVYPR